MKQVKNDCILCINIQYNLIKNFHYFSTLDITEDSFTVHIQNKKKFTAKNFTISQQD